MCFSWRNTGRDDISMMSKKTKSQLLKGIRQILLERSNKQYNAEFPAECYRCNFEPKTKQEYHSHLFEEHRHLAGYPNNASIVKYGLRSQGYWWEV